MRRLFEGKVMDIEPIKTQRDYRRVLKEIEGLMMAHNTAEGDRLDVLVALVEALGAKTLSARSSRPGRSDQISHGAEWASAARPHPVHRQPQSRARGTQPPASADAQNDLALHQGLGIPAESLIRLKQDRAA
jgi:HTH-type transcriptional regulator/antitoxin HigA